MDDDDSIEGRRRRQGLLARDRQGRGGVKSFGRQDRRSKIHPTRSPLARFCGINKLSLPLRVSISLVGRHTQLQPHNSGWLARTLANQSSGRLLLLAAEAAARPARCHLKQH